jgi:RNA polymerase sigma-70 factor (ECF subfamily)
MSSSGERGEEWFTTLYTAHYPDIVRYGLRRVIDTDSSVELAQEVFVVAWRRRDQVPERGLPWLYGVARRLLANEWRARRSHPPALPIDHAEALPQGLDSVQPESVASVLDLRAALATLSDLDQEVLRLVGWEQLTVAEAAVVLDCSRATAAVRLHRARRRLTAALTAPRASRPVPKPRPAPARF